MKLFRSTLIAFSLCLLCICFCACGTTPSEETVPAEPESAPETDIPAESETETEAPDETEPSGSAAEISEAAMENFVRRLESGNYVIDAPDYLKTVVFSPEQVCFSYYSEDYQDQAFMTLEGETFRAALDGDSLSDIRFVSTRDAIEVVDEYLPNFWITASGGSMFEFFYNDPEAPLEFLSNDDTVKTILMKLAGYPDMALARMQDVYMAFDQEDPETVRFTAVVEDDVVARHFYDDLDLTITFGGAESAPAVDAWLSSPVYPETRTGWTEEDIFIFNSIYNPGYGEDAIPFPSFASYALLNDEAVFERYNYIMLSDGHASESDVEQYIAALPQSGFTAAEEELEDGSVITVYRRPLREEYSSYIELYPYYENGFVMEADVYYDSPVYDTLEEINAATAVYGFAPLPEDGMLSEFSATDTAAERTESLLYFVTYDMFLTVNFPYENEEAVNTYLDNYISSLEAAGFTVQYIEDDDGSRIFDSAESENGASSFKFAFNGDGTVTFLFKSDKFYSADQAESLIRSAGFPEVDLHDYITVRDLHDYYNVIMEFTGFYLWVNQTFDTADEAEAFLDEYTARLDEAGYLRTNPDNVGSLKQNAYYNEELNAYVAFDYFPDQEDHLVSMDFVTGK